MISYAVARAHLSYSINQCAPRFWDFLWPVVMPIGAPETEIVVSPLILVRGWSIPPSEFRAFESAPGAQLKLFDWLCQWIVISTLVPAKPPLSTVDFWTDGGRQSLAHSNLTVSQYTSIF
jgi:hypothetical protein